MDLNKILSFKQSDHDTLGMILSHHADMGNSDGLLISVKAWDNLITDLIKWKSPTPPEPEGEPSYGKILALVNRYFKGGCPENLHDLIWKTYQVTANEMGLKIKDHLKGKEIKVTYEESQAEPEGEKPEKCNGCEYWAEPSKGICIRGDGDRYCVKIIPTEG